MQTYLYTQNVFTYLLGGQIEGLSHKEMVDVWCISVYYIDYINYETIKSRVGLGWLVSGHLAVKLLMRYEFFRT